MSEYSSLREARSSSSYILKGLTEKFLYHIAAYQEIQAGLLEWYFTQIMIRIIVLMLPILVLCMTFPHRTPTPLVSFHLLSLE